MVDKTLISIISMIFGGVGLVGAITKYDFPNARKTAYGENLFLLKENIINNVITWFFTLYAMVGLVLQITFGEIFELEERIYDNGTYLIALILALILIASLIPIVKKMGWWVAKSYWIPEVALKAKTNFILAKYIIEHDGRTEDSANPSQKDKEDNFSVANKIANWLEELFEMKSVKQDLPTRLQFFEKIFNK